ncbi:MAG: 30S ribosomal protein S8 [Gemmataceae bacterium]
MMTDPIADMLTRIRNASRIERPTVDMPATKIKANIARVLKTEGFIHDFEVGTASVDEAGHPSFKSVSDFTLPKLTLRVHLKYGPEGERVIRHIRRRSKPGNRSYIRSDQIRPILGGLGISVISTNKGVMSNRQARSQKIGGEILCEVW